MMSEAIVRSALESEHQVNRMINDLVSPAESEKVYGTRSFPNSFVDERAEEEATMTDLPARVQPAGDNVLQVEPGIRREMMGKSRRHKDYLAWVDTNAGRPRTLETERSRSYRWL